MAHRVFRSFPSEDELRKRIASFVARVVRGQDGLALVECPVYGQGSLLSPGEDVALVDERLVGSRSALRDVEVTEVSIEPERIGIDGTEFQVQVVVRSANACWWGWFVLRDTTRSERWTLFFERMKQGDETFER